MADDRDHSSGSTPARVSREPVKIPRVTSPLTPIALLLALIAVGLSVWALVSVPESVPTAQVAAAPAGSGDAKGRVCRAAHTVATAVQSQTNRSVGPEPAAVEAVAANARLAMVGGGEYLASQISADTPTELAEAARTFAGTLQMIGVNALAGVPNTDELQAGRIRDAEAARNELSRLCA
ncbi:hypothetical protein PDG61_29760 [Mycolicibacterium sp. BiH015]|uniref:hypothetical protein n=1 Tax=Mycolicibacterium sp. BiH015 TaxID=3018808 RepID=UPI0022E43B16|nr:hypothetical protein [Mycolicibacterium sp. BiH015]MDA2895133.1 hypothetical protein [Mycolicibacterium sp. BiH015]